MTQRFYCIMLPRSMSSEDTRWQMRTDGRNKSEKLGERELNREEEEEMTSAELSTE